MTNTETIMEHLPATCPDRYLVGPVLTCPHEDIQPTEVTL